MRSFACAHLRALVAQVILNKIEGYTQGRIAQFITNCCHCHWTKDKKLYLSRHGQSE